MENLILSLQNQLLVHLIVKNLIIREYTFTVDQLPAFRTYRIKISLLSNSQSFVPRIKDLRVIALA